MRVSPATIDRLLKGRRLQVRKSRGFTKPGTLIGMVHLGPLPGTPHAVRSLDELIATACSDARILADAGFEMLIVENMGDRPYLMGSIGPEIVSAMTAASMAWWR